MKQISSVTATATVISNATVFVKFTDGDESTHYQQTTAVYTDRRRTLYTVCTIIQPLFVVVVV